MGPLWQPVCGYALIHAGVISLYSFLLTKTGLIRRTSNLRVTLLYLIAQKQEKKNKLDGVNLDPKALNFSIEIQIVHNKTLFFSRQG